MENFLGERQELRKELVLFFGLMSIATRLFRPVV
jgi:hypothetical protein